LNAVVAFLVTYLLIGIAEVAAGEGALQTWIERLVSSNRKSSINDPSFETAIARTPAG
jgi:hypothetical protein